jgi:hypothetical protein
VRRSWRWFLVGVSLLLVLAAAGFAARGEAAAALMSEALSALQPDGQVAVTAGRWLVFTPAGWQPAAGIIINILAAGWMLRRRAAAA